MNARAATLDDAAGITRIYNQGIEGRASTFETRPRTAGDLAGWFDGVHPIVVVEEGQNIIAFGEHWRTSRQWHLFSTRRQSTEARRHRAR
jgi:L-amino acid N-acyltransferase YncA